MNQKEKVKEIFLNSNKALTVYDVQAELEKMDTPSIRVYINRLQKEGFIEKDGKIGKWVLYKYKNPAELKVPENSLKFKKALNLLKFLDDFFKQNLLYLMGDTTIKNSIMEHVEFDEIDKLIEEFKTGDEK